MKNFLLITFALLVFSYHVSAQYPVNRSGVSVVDGGGIEPWEAGGTVYDINDVVYVNNKIYVATALHTSTLDFNNDIANWIQLSAGGSYKWVAGAFYNVDDIVYVTDTSRLYYCTTAHTSSGTFSTDIANWSEISEGIALSPSSTDNAVIRWNGTTGDASKNSGVIIDDSDNVSGVGNLTVSGTTTLDTGLTGVLKSSSGVVSTSPVDLTSEISGVLPIANGGTGSSTQNFVDLTTSQSVGGIKTFTSSLDVEAGADIEGPVTINNIGSGNVVTITQDSNGNALTIDQNGSGNALSVSGDIVVDGDVSIVNAGQLSVGTLDGAAYLSSGVLNVDSNVDATELSYLDGVTSSIQDQLNTLDAKEVTLQDSYDSSVDGEIVLDSTRNSFKILDNATSIENPLFEILSNDELTNYFSVGLLNVSTNVDFDMNGTGALKFPVGTTAQRPSVAREGDTRRNTDEECLETYNGTEWECVGTGGGGGSAGINFVTDASFEAGDLNPDTNSATETYETYIADTQLYSEFNLQYFKAAYTGLTAADTYVRDSFARTGMDDSQGFFSIWAKVNADEFKLCIRVDDSDYSENCDSALEVNLVGDDTWRKYEIPFVYGAASVEYEIYNESFTGDVNIEVDKVYIGTIPDGYIKDVAVITEWQSYIPTNTQGFGTISSPELRWRRVGTDIEIAGRFTGGVPTSSEAQIGLPTGLVISSSVKTRDIVGQYDRNLDENTVAEYVILAAPSASYLNVGRRDSTETPFSPATGINVSANSQVVGFFASVPIQGWSATSGAIIAQGNTTTPNRAGQIIWESGNTITTNDLVLANGDCYKKTDYPDYMANVGVIYGECTIDTSNDGFNVIDLVSSNRFIRSSGGSLSVGQLQDDATAVNGLSMTSDTHTHGIYSANTNSTNSDIRAVSNSRNFGGTVLSSSEGYRTTFGANNAQAIQNDTHSHILSGNSETRPVSVALRPFVRLRNLDNVIVGKFANIKSSDLVKVRAYQTTSQNFSDDVQTPITYDSEDQDNYNTHSNGVFTCPKISKFTASFNLYLDSLDDNGSTALLNLYDSTNTVYREVFRFVNTGADGDTNVNGSASISFECSSVGQEFQFRALINTADSGTTGTRAGTASVRYSNLFIDELPDTESIVKNLVEDKMECQTKYLSADITTDTTLSDLTFNNLEIGKNYEVSLQMRGTRNNTTYDSFGIRPSSGGVNIGLVNTAMEGQSGYTLSIEGSYKFEAQGTTLFFTSSSVATDSVINGDGTTDETFATLCQLPSSTILNSNKWD